MTEHLPECRLSEPCDIDIAEHGFCSMQVEEQFFCIHCRGECICERLRTCEARVLRRMLEAAREVIDDLPAPYKMRGSYETFGPYHEGKADFKDTALSAIDALLEEYQ